MGDETAGKKEGGGGVLKGVKGPLVRVRPP